MQVQGSAGRLPGPRVRGQGQGLPAGQPDAADPEVHRRRPEQGRARQAGRRRSWEKTKKRVKEHLLKMAAELLQLYAARRRTPATPSPRPTATSASSRPTSRSTRRPTRPRRSTTCSPTCRSREPMDRLVCGDVGYGKTEVAMRAAFKAVLDGKQVAVLAPTTVLAEQHFLTFTEALRRTTRSPSRWSSRLRKPREVREVAQARQRGQGRHRDRHAPAARRRRALQGPRAARRSTRSSASA